MQSVPYLLNGVLRAAVSQTELPYISEMKDRLFPLRRKNCETATNFFINDLYNIENINDQDLSKDHQAEETINLLEKLCLESEFGKTGVAPDLEAPAGNIKVRHIQPIERVPQKTYRNISSHETDPQSRKSLIMLRRAFFEQTAKIFQPYKGILVYDVMNQKIESDRQSIDG